MKIEKGVLGLGVGSKRSDGTQDEIVTWENKQDIKDTAEFYFEMKISGWDIPLVYAKTNNGKYVIGDAHSIMCGVVVSKEFFCKAILNKLNDLDSVAEKYKKILELTK